MIDLHYSLCNPWMAAHAEIVVAAPHRNTSLVGQGLGVIVCHRELCSSAVHRFKHPVRVIVLLSLNFLLKELIVAKVGDSCEGRTQAELKREVVYSFSFTTALLAQHKDV